MHIPERLGSRAIRSESYTGDTDYLQNSVPNEETLIYTIFNIFRQAYVMVQ